MKEFYDTLLVKVGVNNLKLIILAILALFALIILIILIKKLKNGKLKSELAEIQIAFNDLSSIPLAFKLNKASSIAKINEDLAKQVEEYRHKYEICAGHIEEIKALMLEADDAIDAKERHQAQTVLVKAKRAIEIAKKEAREIEEFLDKIAGREEHQREDSNTLKDKYREIRQKVQTQLPQLSFAGEGIMDELKVCEDLFSAFEEQIYANNYAKAEEHLQEVAERLTLIEQNLPLIPQLIELAKGDIPGLIDEIELKNNLSLQRNVCVSQINIPTRLSAAKADLKRYLKNIAEFKVVDLTSDLNREKQELEEILGNIEKENTAFTNFKNDLAVNEDNLADIVETYTYLSAAYQQSKDKFDLSELAQALKDKDQVIAQYQKQEQELKQALNGGLIPPTALLAKLNALFNELTQEKEQLSTLKSRIDSLYQDENRALAQLTKLQIVMNEVEVKIAEHRLPSISAAYQDDLKAAHEKVEAVKRSLAAVPFKPQVLNQLLAETIDFVYQLYNNVNNIIGMALYVENAIVFGNKYRSTYKEVDSELSKAEFAYLNGEYTQGLTIAIACIDKLFPKKNEQKPAGAH